MSKPCYIKTNKASGLRGASVENVKENDLLKLDTTDWEDCLVFKEKRESAEAIAKFLNNIKGHETPQQLMSLLNNIIINPEHYK